MDLTARDIHEKLFHDAWRGYNQEEVDDFLDRIAEVLDRVQRENQTLQQRVQELDTAVSASRDTEEMLKKTLVSAQQAAEEAIATAKAKASDLITEAEERAQRSIAEATQRVESAEEEARRKTLEAEREHERKRAELDANIARLQALENELKGRIKGFLDQQAQALQGLEIVGPPPEIRGPSRAEEGAPDEPPVEEGPAGDRGTATGEAAEGGAERPEATGGRGTETPAASAAVLVDDRTADKVVTLAPDASTNGGGGAEPAQVRRGVRGLFGRDEG